MKIENYLSVLKKVELFKEIPEKELLIMLKCLNARVSTFNKGEFLMMHGAQPTDIGIVIEGILHVYKSDYEGNRIIIARLHREQIFGEALCCAGIISSPVNVVCDEEAVIVNISFSSILHTCPKNCNHHAKLIENMIRIIANKNLFLQSRLEIIALKSIRLKVLRYLESFINKQGKEITIPFNREELADFLGVERTALSHELTKMKREGLIDYHKNHFKLKK